MLAIAVYVGTFAYGRMAKGFELRAWMVLAVIATVVTLFSMMIERASPGFAVLIAFVIQFSIMMLLFALGVALGKWLDRNKNLD